MSTRPPKLTRKHRRTPRVFDATKKEIERRVARNQKARDAYDTGQYVIGAWGLFNEGIALYALARGSSYDSAGSGLTVRQPARWLRWHTRQAAHQWRTKHPGETKGLLVWHLPKHMDRRQLD